MTLIRPFNFVEVVLLFLSFLAYVIDIVSDILVAVLYFSQDHFIWGSLTVSLIVLPSIAIQIFSGRWYIADKCSHSAACWLTHLLQLQPIERYIRVIKAGINARKYKTAEKIDCYYYQQNDVCMLRLFEAFLESAPQLTLQLYIILCTDSANWLTGGSACISLLALGWALASYSHALRQAYQEQYLVHAPTLLLQTVWHVAVVGVRVCSLVAFAAIFEHWVFLAVGIHWIVMTVWVMVQGTDFCPTKVEEKLFDCVVGVIYCFTFFNLKEGKTRWRALAFYSLMFVENAAALTVWYLYRGTQAWFHPLILTAAGCVYFFGIGCMLLYYRFCHPSGPIPCCSPPKELYHHHSTPDFTRHACAQNPSKASLAPRFTSTVQLPRRTFLKLQSSKLNVEYKEVGTPSGLSPIKLPSSRYHPKNINHSGYDTSLQLDDNSAFQHYSIDATAGLMPPSRVATLQGKGIDLSSDGFSLTQPDSYAQLNSDEVTESPSVGNHLSPVKYRKRSDKDSAVFDQTYSRCSHDFCAMNCCPHCKKGYRYMDQSYESLGNRTVAYCHCTLSEDQWLALGCPKEFTEVSRSSGFHSELDFNEDRCESDVLKTSKKPTSFV